MFIIISKLNNPDSILNIIQVNNDIINYSDRWATLIKEKFDIMYQKIIDNNLYKEHTFYNLYIMLSELKYYYNINNNSYLENKFKFNTDRHKIDEYINNVISILNKLGYEVKIYSSYANQKAREC
jgi:hypothetical protein